MLVVGTLALAGSRWGRKTDLARWFIAQLAVSIVAAGIFCLAGAAKHHPNVAWVGAGYSLASLSLWCFRGSSLCAHIAAALILVSYHPQSGWLDEGPQRGPLPN